MFSHFCGLCVGPILWEFLRVLAAVNSLANEQQACRVAANAVDFWVVFVREWRYKVGTITSSKWAHGVISDNSHNWGYNRCYIGRVA